MLIRPSLNCLIDSPTLQWQHLPALPRSLHALFVFLFHLRHVCYNFFGSFWTVRTQVLMEGNPEKLCLFGLKKVAADILILWWMVELLGEELNLWFQINVSDISCIELILVSTEDLVILLWSCPEKPYLAIRSLLATRFPQQTVVLYKGSKTLLLNETYPLFPLRCCHLGINFGLIERVGFDTAR